MSGELPPGGLGLGLFPLGGGGAIHRGTIHLVPLKIWQQKYLFEWQQNVRQLEYQLRDVLYTRRSPGLDLH